MYDQMREGVGMTQPPTEAPDRRQRGFVVLHLEFHKDDDRWYGRCAELGTSTFADDSVQVQRELIELVELHLKGLEDIGQRERFFEENGVRIYRFDETVPSVGATVEVTEPVVPITAVQTAVKISIPA